jgi:hypothetical protein
MTKRSCSPMWQKKCAGRFSVVYQRFVDKVLDALVVIPMKMGIQTSSILGSGAS